MPLYCVRAVRQYVTMVVLFCAVSDALLICTGVFGLGRLFAPLMQEFQNVIFGSAAIWLGVYGGMRLNSARMRTHQIDASSSHTDMALAGACVYCSNDIGNPHVYLDTLLLIEHLVAGLEMAGKLPLLQAPVLPV